MRGAGITKQDFIAACKKLCDDKSSSAHKSICKEHECCYHTHYMNFWDYLFSKPQGVEYMSIVDDFVNLEFPNHSKSYPELYKHSDVSRDLQLIAYELGIL